MKNPLLFRSLRCALAASALLPTLAPATATEQPPNACAARSGEKRTPVLELYTSEGCSSCPPADQWLSTLKDKPLVVQAFHVSYWDYIGWVDRFASAANNARQRELAAINNLRTIYTPQLVRNARDWRDYGRAADPAGTASVRIALQVGTSPNHFEAHVEPQANVGPWAAYWTVTEDSHESRVKAGENAGATLLHDFVVRQYVPVGQYVGPQRLRLSSLAAQKGHQRRINLVVFDPRTLEPLQALSLPCS